MRKERVFYKSLVIGRGFYKRVFILMGVLLAVALLTAGTLPLQFSGPTQEDPSLFL